MIFLFPNSQYFLQLALSQRNPLRGFVVVTQFHLCNMDDHNILMVCDFFWPNLGGVEMHIWSLAQCLLLRGHKVTILTHAWGDRHGVRYMTNGLKVYYIPWVTLFSNCTLPSIFPMFPIFRDIVIREQIDIVHGHQDSSALMHEALFHAQTMGIKTCFTSHSLFNIYDFASLHLNKILKFSLCTVDHCIAVSNTCRINMLERGNLLADDVTAIPNAVDTSYFIPDPSKKDPKPRINIVVVNRMVYRKGADLVARLVPIICKKYPNVHFIIGGDGDKRLQLDEMRERYQLHERVELLGGVPHDQVRNVLCRGSIFLNCSLTESFCIAILEAASCGLHVVSTRVGGIVEILPRDMISFASTPSTKGLVECLERVLSNPKYYERDPFELHNRVKNMYNWRQVAERTCLVYDKLKQRPVPTWYDKIRGCYNCGPVAGTMALVLTIIDYILLQILGFFHPVSGIDIAPRYRPQEHLKIT